MKKKFFIYEISEYVVEVDSNEIDLSNIRRKQTLEKLMKAKAYLKAGQLVKTNSRIIETVCLDEDSPPKKITIHKNNNKY